MALSFSTTERATEHTGVKMLVYSPAGMGKTVLTATLPAPILISAESGLLSLRRKNLERLFGVNTPGITYEMPVIQVRTFLEFREAYDWLNQSAEAKQFASVGIDSLSEIAEALLNSEKKFHKDPRQAYGSMADNIEQKVREFRDLPGRHVYFTSKMESNKDEVTGATMWTPSMPGNKTGPKLPYLFDEVFTYRAAKNADGTEYRFLQTQPDTQFSAKDRSGVLDPVEYPHLGNIISKIIGA